MGSGKGKRYTYTPDYTAQNTFAQQVRKQWDRYEAKYMPIVSGLIGELGSHPEEIDAAVNTSNVRQDRASQDVFETLGMYGTQLSPIQREAMLSKLKASKSLEAVKARTLQRRTIDDRNDALRTALVGEGSGVRGLANQAIGEAATAEQERNAAGYQIAAQKTARSQAKAQATMQMIGQGLGTAAMIAAAS